MLAEETRQLMHELFGPEVCRRCGHAAERLHKGRFYCRRHYPRAASWQVPVLPWPSMQGRLPARF